MPTTPFATQALPAEPTVVAPDGSDVRVLLALRSGSMAHFELPARRISQAVMHRAVEEISHVLAAKGEMWRRQNERAEITRL